MHIKPVLTGGKVVPCFCPCLLFDLRVKIVSKWLTRVLQNAVFRVQYSIDIADRLADEHVLIGLYVNLLQKNRTWLVGLACG